jgi:tRNA-dihydrouridine synthase C
MEGVTNGIFRDLICEIGSVDFVATEFVRITSSNQRIKPFYRHSQHTTSLQIQLMASGPDALCGCIEQLQESGALLPHDWLDLNVGCPSKKVNASGAGAALLKSPRRLLEIIENMRLVHKGPLSIKTRPAINDVKEFPQLLSVLQRAPLDFITLHARASCAVHSGPIHFDALQIAAQTLPYPVIGNGDIWSAEDARNMIASTGIRGVMCGRGMLRNPFLLRDIRAGLDLAPDLRVQEIRGFVTTLARRYAAAATSPTSYCGTFKELCGWLSKNPLIGKQFFEAIKREVTIQDLLTKTDEFFAEFSPSFVPQAPLL